jgi:hypothetical protein
MTTQTADLRIAATLRKKVEQFYEHLNRGELVGEAGRLG